MAVVFHHCAVQVAGDTHDCGVGGFTLCQFGYRKVAEIMEPQARKRSRGALPCRDSGAQAAAGFQGFACGFSAGAPGRFLSQCALRGTPCLLRPGRIIPCSVAGRFRLPIQEPGKYEMRRVHGPEGAGAFE